MAFFPLKTTKFQHILLHIRISFLSLSSCLPPFSFLGYIFFLLAAVLGLADTLFAQVLCCLHCIPSPSFSSILIEDHSLNSASVCFFLQRPISFFLHPERGKSPSSPTNHLVLHRLREELQQAFSPSAHLFLLLAEKHPSRTSISLSAHPSFHSEHHHLSQSFMSFCLGLTCFSCRLLELLPWCWSLLHDPLHHRPNTISLPFLFRLTNS